MARARPKQAAAITGGQTADVRHRGNQGTKHKSVCVVEPNCSIDLHLAVKMMGWTSPQRLVHLNRATPPTSFRDFSRDVRVVPR
jgi:hypothetical protein